MEILETFFLLLNRLGPKLWVEEDPAVVFATIKDNPTYMEVLCTLKDSDSGSRLIRWIETFVKSLDVTVLHTIVPLVIQFLCEELQHERYDVTRPFALTSAAKVGTFSSDCVTV